MNKKPCLCDTVNPSIEPVQADDPDGLRRGLLALLPGLLPALTVASAAHAQDAVKVQPGGYRVAFENDRLRVLEFNSRPGLGVCGIGMHSHPAHLTVALTPAKVRLKFPDGSTKEGSNDIGDVFWSEAETHEAENISGRNTRALLIELKTPPARKA